MGEPKIWRVKYTWARQVGGGYETAFGEMLVEETGLDLAIVATHKYFQAFKREVSIQSIENLGPLVVRL